MPNPSALCVIAMDVQWANFWIQFAYTIVTLGVLVVAVFGEPIRNRWWGPKLRMRLNDPNGFVVKRQDGTPTRYYHLEITNERPSVPARGVRVVCTSMRIMNEDPCPRDVVIPFRLQLVWTPLGSRLQFPTISRIDRCDLGHLDMGSDRFEFDFYDKPNEFSSFVPRRGCVHVSLEAEAENCSLASRATFEVKWDGEWSDNDEEMAQHLIVRQISDTY